MRLLILLISAILTGCSDNVLLPLDEMKEVTVLTRIGSTTYSVDGIYGPSGFEHDLARLFAKELGLKIRFVVAASDADIQRRLKNGEAHMAAAWQIPSEDPDFRASIPYAQSQNVLITAESSLPVSEIEQLKNRKVHVIKGSRQESSLREIQQSMPDFTIVARRKKTEIDLMEGVSTQRYEAALIDKAAFDLGNNFYPDLQPETLEIGIRQPISWLFAPGVDEALIEKANAFLDKMKTSGEMNRLKDRYFGHVERLTQADSLRFIERMHTVLPRYRALFFAAQENTGIDWRILAALAYQESQWEPLATSPTGVRGMMMLTGDTADHLGVTNRLDPVQSIRAGSAYLRDLRDQLPPEVSEPDRLWFALAAYNLGMGHLNAARSIAKQIKVNPDSWYEMKKVLPLLAKPEYYSRLKSG